MLPASLGRQQSKQAAGGMQDTVMVSVCLHSPECHMLDRPTEPCQCIQHGQAGPAAQQRQRPRQTHTYTIIQ